MPAHFVAIHQVDVEIFLRMSENFDLLLAQVEGSPQSLGFIILGTMSVQNVMATQSISEVDGLSKVLPAYRKQST